LKAGLNKRKISGLSRKDKNIYRRKRSKPRSGISSFPLFPSVQLPAGAEAQWLFMPEPDNRKTRLAMAGQAVADADQFKS
jgi:hypothetical protein